MTVQQIHIAQQITICPTKRISQAVTIHCHLLLIAMIVWGRSATSIENAGESLVFIQVFPIVVIVLPFATHAFLLTSQQYSGITITSNKTS
jgi:hypothetical protein